MKGVRCADARVACDFVAQADTEEDLMKGVAAYACQKGGITLVTSELADTAKRIMHDEK